MTTQCDPPTTHRYRRVDGTDTLRCVRCWYEKGGTMTTQDDRTRLLTQAIHEHMNAVGYCAHYTGTPGGDPQVPWLECEHEAAAILATPSGRLLLAGPGEDPEMRAIRESTAAATARCTHDFRRGTCWFCGEPQPPAPTCDHGEVQSHGRGRIFCVKCRRWGGIDQPSAPTVERLARALIKEHNMEMLPAFMDTQSWAHAKATRILAALVEP
jgi:hypothetical protein